MRFTIKWIKSYKDIPLETRKKAHIDRKDNLVALADDDGIIYAIKGKATEASVLHEMFHLIKKHPTKPRDPKTFVLQELQAHMYGYSQLKKPRHLIGELRANFNDLCFNVYKCSSKDALTAMHDSLVKVKAPPTWMSDYNRLVKEVKEAER